jgi:hypothetical protein
LSADRPDAFFLTLAHSGDAMPHWRAPQEEAAPGEIRAGATASRIAAG